jgi:hypothetical protein
MKEAIGRLLSGATTTLLVEQAAPRPSTATRKAAPAAVLAVIRIEVILGR